MTSFVGGNAFLLSTSQSQFQVPAPAQAVGYIKNTFRSSTLNNSVGNLYYPANFYGYTAPALGQPGAVAQQNMDGSFTLLGSTNVAVSSAQYSAGSVGQFVGTAFGGGCYVEASMAWNPGTGASSNPMPQMSFTDIETMAYNAVTTGNVWPGLTATLSAGSANVTLNFPTSQNYRVGDTIIFTALTAPLLTEASGEILTRSGEAILSTIAGTTGTVTGVTLNTTYYVVSTGTNTVQVSATAGGTAITLGGTGTVSVGLAFVDSIQMRSQYAIGSTQQLLYGFENYFASVVSGAFVKSLSDQTVIQSGNSFANQNNFGMLWVPATDIATGYVTWYFNETAFYTQTWNEYNPALQPPPVVGTSAFSVLDTRHIAILFQTSTTYPMTVASVNVWQSSAVNNLVHAS